MTNTTKKYDAESMITFKVYVNNDGRAVYAGNVSARTYQEAKAEVIATGVEEKDFMLIR